MPPPRCICSTTSSATFFKAAIQSYSRTCPYTSRNFASCIGHRQSSKRKLVTTSSYRPTTLDPIPPPRNAGTPETSIAEAIPQINDIRPPPFEPEASHQTSKHQTKNPLHVSEEEAQTSKPVSTSPSPTTTPLSSNVQPPKKERPKLRPRKASMKLSPSAVEHLRDLLSQPEPKLIRVGVKNRGCSGLAYHLEYVDKPGSFDEAVEQDGVKVLIDSKALFSIIGSEMDWAEDKLEQKFIFRNPNIKEQCGCGESFMV